MKFRASILQSGQNTTGIDVPEEIVTALGQGKKPPVRVTLNGHMYRSTIASMGGVFMISLSAENRAAAGVAGGDEVEVELEFDAEPREVTVPLDFADALDRDLVARTFCDGLSYSNRRRHVLSDEGAKTPKTRQRRIDKAIESLREGNSSANNERVQPPSKPQFTRSAQPVFSLLWKHEDRV